MKKLLLATTLAFSATAFAVPLEQRISSFEVKEISAAEFDLINSEIAQQTVGGVRGGEVGGVGGGGIPTNPGQYDPYPQQPYPYPSQQGPSRPGFDDKLDKVGRVVSTARDMVALGEAVYTLAQKGKPSNVTEYAPISVVPRTMSGEPVDPFDLEGFGFPLEKNFKAEIKNGTGKAVVSFAYKVVYSAGGSYNGAGKYLTNVMIIPSAVKTSFGWDFNATMKVGGIMNHGSKNDPVAGVMVLIKYQMNSWTSAFERNDSIHISGNGELKTYFAK